MKNIWTDETNGLNVCMVNAEICSKINFSMACNQFKVLVTQSSKLLKDAKSYEEYCNDDESYTLISSSFSSNPLR